jgi:hypothetical protein
VAVGDSFTWCHEVATTDAWPHVFAERTGSTAYNLGLGGLGLHEYLQVLKRFGIAEGPDVVVLNVYEGNDLRDAFKYASHRAEVAGTGKSPSGEPENLFSALLENPIGRRSYGLNLLTAYISLALRRASEPNEKSDIEFRYTLRFADAEVPFNVEHHDRDEVLFARRLARGEVSLSLWEAPLRELAELSSEHDFRAVVAYTPSAHTAYRAHARFREPSVGAEVQALSRAQRAYLREAVGALGMQFHDFTPDLERAAEEGGAIDLLYDPRSVHLTVRGNEALARSLQAALGN